MRAKRTKSAGTQNIEPHVKIPLFTEKEAGEYERTKIDLIEVLKRMGDYEPAVDCVHIDQIARTVIYMKKVDVFLDADTANEDTYSRVTDVKLKLSKILENAIHELALARRDRIGKDSETSLMQQLREELMRALSEQ